MFTALQPGHVINFLQSIAARVKANGGKLCVTVGTGIDKADMMKLEENSDRNRNRTSKLKPRTEQKVKNQETATAHTVTDGHVSKWR